MTLTQRFLRAKHWQLFLLTFGIPMIFQFVMMGTMFANIGNQTQPDPTAFLFIFPLMMIVFTGTFFGWFWSIAMGLQYKVPANVKMKTGKFKVFFFTQLVYMLLIFIGMGIMMAGLSNTLEGGQQPDPGIVFGSIAVILPLHLFSMFCMFYCLYFVAKTFKTVELQREVTFSDFAGEFFMIWFFPIGIWIIQPKVNKMVDGSPGLLIDQPAN